MSASKRATPKAIPAAAATAISPATRRAFRWVAALVLPLSLLMAAELVLRAAGWHYPTHFFIPAGSDSSDGCRENPKFGWRFFPRRLARAPDPVRIVRTKGPGTVRIMVFGESAALGDPVPAYGFSRILRELLEERCVDVKFEVVNVSVTAINSHAILQIAQDCVPFQADVWIIYMGNNEVVGPFGAGSVFGLKAPPLWVIRASLMAKRTCLGQLVDEWWQRASVRQQAFHEWEGMKMMVKEVVRRDDPSLARVYQHFRENLEDILAMGRRAGVKTLLCSMSANLKDCPPFASLNGRHLSPDQKSEWDRLTAAGAASKDRREIGPALAAYRQAFALDPAPGELAFRIARCEMALGDTSLARAHYALSRDLDVLRFRADTQINRIIREVCDQRRQQGVSLADAEQWVAEASPAAIPGYECFWDHVHFNFAGNYRVARGLADGILSQLPDVLNRTAATGRWLTETECAERLAFTEWDQRAVLETMMQRVADPPFTSQLDHTNRAQRWSELHVELDHKLDGPGLARSAEIYRQALSRRGDDWILHHRFGLLLEATGDYSGAEQHWRQVVRLMPDYVDALFKLGENLTSQSRPAEAEAFYDQVLRLRPESFEAMNGLGLALLEQGRLEEAPRFLHDALRLQPKFTQAHINLGLIASRSGKLAEAEAHYRNALAAAPHTAAALINLGNLLAQQQRHQEAVTIYHEAIQLKPTEATIHLSLANSLAATGRIGEAVEQFRRALGLNADLADAHFNLGVLLAKQGDLAGATQCFHNSARLNPQDPQAHLNLGVALAKQKRWPEARIEFQAVLRLDASNAAARQYLQAVSTKEGAAQ